MSNHRNDPTANAAIGAVEREMRMMRKWAKKLALLRAQGRLTPEQEREARRQFGGIYRSIWREVMKE